MLVMKKAAFGNLEDYVERELPMDYLKPCQLALSITKDIKDLHWSFVHGNIHPRNVLLNYADYVGELVDITFMQRSNNNKSSKSWAGRWPYVAPEVISTGLSTAADMYALGIILWQLVSRVTFPDNALVDPSVYRIEPIPGILEEWESLYIDCLHTDPDKRPNAYTMYRRLTQLAARQQQSPTPLSTMTTDYMKARRSEIQGFLDRESTFIYGSPCNVTNNYTTYNSLVHVGDHVLTTSITRPSHKELESYPNLIQHFPPYY
jgi:serine/threonine protein kinase